MGSSGLGLISHNDLNKDWSALHLFRIPQDTRGYQLTVEKIILATLANSVRTPVIAVVLDVFNKLSQIFSARRSGIVRTDVVDDGLIDGIFLNKIRSCHWFNKSQDAITETIRSGMIYFRPCDPDRTIAFHKRRARSVYQIHKIRNQVHCCLNHDMNDSLLSLKPIEIVRSKLHGKRQTENAVNSLLTWQNFGTNAEPRSEIFVCVN